jgi:hypothetical protein
VSWTNTGAKPHTATFDDLPLDTGQLAPGASAELTAPGEAGTYSYFCAVHPTQMRGVLVVAPLSGLVGAGVAGAERAIGEAGAEETDGTVLAYVIAVAVVGVGVLGLVLALRRRPA